MTEEQISKNPICVDLDGTLIATDILKESFLLLLKKNLFYIFFIPFWLLRGKAYLKRKIYTYAKPEASTLPYREDVVNFLVQEKAKGRKIVLVTATLQDVADDISSYLKIFNEAYGTSGDKNLKGENKKEFLIEKYGDKGFDYIGDDKSDACIWKSADKAMLVKPGSYRSNGFKFDKEFEKKRNIFKLVIKEIRVYQWVKNALIFIPVFLAHKASGESMAVTLLAFISFSLCASSVYVLNDLLDLESDRLHPRKKNRPLASGDLSIMFGIALFPIMLLSSFIMALTLLPLEYSLVLFLYLFTTTAYSFLLKKVAVLDIFVLAFLYTIRLIAGAAAAQVPASHWLLAFSLFIFLSLAILKRYTELKVLIDNDKSELKGRAYNTSDIGLLQAIGPASGYISALVLALYVQSPEVSKLYSKPEMLWLVAPLLLFWITRMWFLSGRGKMHDDPIFFTVKDPYSYIIGITVAAIIFSAALWQ